MNKKEQQTIVDKINTDVEKQLEMVRKGELTIKEVVDRILEVNRKKYHLPRGIVK